MHLLQSVFNILYLEPNLFLFYEGSLQFSSKDRLSHKTLGYHEGRVSFQLIFFLIYVKCP